MTRITDLAEQVAELAHSRGLWIAAAESLTGGAVSSALAAAPGASDWYHGGVVAYSPRVKQHLLGVTPGPVVTARCADELAQGVDLRQTYARHPELVMWKLAGRAGIGEKAGGHPR